MEIYKQQIKAPPVECDRGESADGRTNGNTLQERRRFTHDRSQLPTCITRYIMQFNRL